jgi:hypothetical protein
MYYVEAKKVFLNVLCWGNGAYINYELIPILNVQFGAVILFIQQLTMSKILMK